MRYDLDNLNVVSLKAAFVDAAIYKISDCLISYSAAISNGKILAYIVVSNAITPSDEEGTMDILGDVVGHFPGASADFQLIKIEGGQPVPDSEAFPIKLFRRAS
jgi:hypothetical protein